MDVTFFYQNNNHSYKREIIITRLTEAISKIIELPDSIEVCLYDLGPGVYGGIDKTKVNRIGINYSLRYEEIPQILTHELIHVNQKHRKMLEIKPDFYYWLGIPYNAHKNPEDLPYKDYINLPWEIDVQIRQTKVLQMALESLVQKNNT